MWWALEDGSFHLLDNVPGTLTYIIYAEDKHAVLLFNDYHLNLQYFNICALYFA